MTYLLAHAQQVALLAGAHMLLVATALACAFSIALPLGIVAAHRPRLRAWVTGALGAIYTIPSLALLALLVEAVGLGPAPVFIALVAYGQFMLVRNIITGVLAVDPAQRDAALGVGMSALQTALRVDVPQALPVIVGGVRVCTVTMIALATLGGYVGAGGLGSLIFLGLTLHHNDEIVAGSLAVCALAVACDLALRSLERAVKS
jgi:osmoprotectant transport system permease protein